MQVNIWTFVIVCPLIFLAGFVDSIAGGGGVISLPAYLIAGVPIKLAAGTNKFVNGCGTALASYKYIASGNVDWLCAVPSAVGSLIGSAAGASLAMRSPAAGPDEQYRAPYLLPAACPAAVGDRGAVWLRPAADCDGPLGAGYALHPADVSAGK